VIIAIEIKQGKQYVGKTVKLIVHAQTMKRWFVSTRFDASSKYG
jgi:hypothetical protein